MASNSNIDIEGATQHLRDILKLDRPGNSADASSDALRMTSFNGELNGLLGAAGLLGGTDRSSMSDSTRPISTDLCSTQECQIICLSGDDGSTCIPITSNNVEIVASQDTSINSKARGSNKVKIQPVAKYDWEHKYYYGRLIAVSNSFLAYAIRGANNHAMIRVLSVSFTERSLLKGFTGAVTDLAFAHLDSSLLGCVDEAGNLMVWQLTCAGSKILDQIVVHIRRPEDSPLSSYRRLIWCPFIQDEDNQDDTSQTLALLHEDLAEVWDLEVLRANHSSWPVDEADVKEGLIQIDGHTQRVSEGALSPDGTVLATASHDGYIKFWQIYIEGVQDKPRCLHELRPHGGRPLSCLLFCDNHKRQDPEVPFWRFLITGADQNQELKVWCTVSWTCLQTIRFSPDLFNSSVLPSLKASLDLASEFLVLTDVQRKVLYVMELRQDLDKGKASFTAVSEFLLTHPVLSFGVRDVAHCRLRHTEVLPAEEESESMTAEGTQGPTESKSGIQIKLYCVHTKSLQDVQIWFQPNLSSTLFLTNSDTQDGFGFSDHLTDQSSDKESGSGSQTDLRKIPSLPATTDFLSLSGTKLMTPDAFMTPSTSVPASPGSSASSLTIGTALSSNSESTNRAADEVSQSPSRAESLGGSLALSASSPRAVSAALMPGLENIQPLASPSGPLALDGPQVLDSPLLPPLASPTRARSPDVISSASTAMSQDMPEIASQTLQLQRVLVSGLEPLPLSALQADSMASAASALHLLTSPRTANNGLLPLELGGADGLVGGAAEPEPRLNHTPSLLENALSQENPGAGGGSPDGGVGHTPWPAAPDITRETRNSLRDNGLGEWLPVKDWKTSPRASPKVKRKTKKDDNELSQSRQMDSGQMNAEVQDELLMLLRSQQRELTDLRGQIEAMQSTIMAQVEHVLTNHQEQEQRRLERVLAESQNHQRQLQEQLGQQLSSTLSSVLTNRMDKVLREEMKKTVPTAISKSLDPVTGQLSNTIAAKLTAVEITLKDNVSKNITDAIGRAAADAMQGPIQAAYKDAFQGTVLPVFERGCQSMFQQINDSFKQGTQEYIQQLESHMKTRKQREQEARDPVIGQLQQTIESFQSSTDQLTSSITANVRAEVQHQIQMMVGNLQESILSHVQRIVKGEVTLAMKEQQVAVTSSIMQAMRSAASTPVPTAHLDYQTQQANILQLLQQGQLNQAFQQALSATDLNLVLYVCETIDSQQVFGQHPCPLSQPVLLSLIQQLSSNLTTRSELKISYLEDAVMNLDHGDPLTRDHMSSVLAQVRPKLFAFLQQDPHSPLSKRARRLMMMLQGLVSH
ncbi:Enhancer of mRNA-decapping protein 4 [Liparis tanakae]|uniref:Enhancer of mRNA-decapping protein 4 n=1 Tax=Liparis tanakae TaxID=230148 RepID=A0A4Z2FD49_9TELE|nr:Enhancer of mRNA-decapping protein 4 [Liparis tanakae]